MALVALSHENPTSFADAVVVAALQDPSFARRFEVVRRLSSYHHHDAMASDANDEEDDDDMMLLYEAIDRFTAPQQTVALMLFPAKTKASAQRLMALGTKFQSPRVVRLVQTVPIISSNKMIAGHQQSSSKVPTTAIIWQYIKSFPSSSSTVVLPSPSSSPLVVCRPTLTDFVASRAHLFERDVQQIIRCVLQGLHVMHGEGYAYRSMSTEWLLVEGPQDVKLRLTPGCCSVRSTPTSSIDSLPVRDGFGCPRFLAPEVIEACFWPSASQRTTTEAGSYSGAAADMWALGVLTHVLLFGDWPGCLREEDQVWGRLRLLSKLRTAKSFTQQYDAQKVGGEKLSPEAYRFLGRLLEADTGKRMSAREALLHPWILQLDQGKQKKQKKQEEEPAMDEKASLTSTIHFFQMLQKQYAMERLGGGGAAAAAAGRTPQHVTFFPQGVSDRTPTPFGSNTPMRERYERAARQLGVKPNSQLLELWSVATRPLVDRIDLSDNCIGRKGFAALLTAISISDQSEEDGELNAFIPVRLMFNRCTLDDKDVELFCDKYASSRALRTRLQAVSFEGCSLLTCQAARRLLMTCRRYQKGSALKTVSLEKCPAVTEKLRLKLQSLQL